MQHRKENNNAIQSKKKVVSTQDLIDHVARIKTQNASYQVKEDFIKRLKKEIYRIFPRANFELEDQTMKDTSIPQHESKVRLHIKEFKNARKFYQNLN